MSKPLVRVAWTDSGMSRSDGWEKPGEIVASMHVPGALEVFSVGYLIHEDRDHVILAQSLDVANDSYLNAQMIWRPAISSIEILLVLEPDSA